MPGEAQYTPDGFAEWTTVQSSTGACAVKLDSGTTADTSRGRIRFSDVNIQLSALTDISFWYNISSSSTLIPNIETTWPIYVRSADTGLIANGYFSPYIVLDLDTNGDGVADAWLISQQWAEPASRLDTWQQWFMTTASKHWTEACWHNEAFLNLAGGPTDAGWEPLSSWQSYYPAGTVILTIKLAIGEWPFPQQIAMAVDLAINGQYYPFTDAPARDTAVVHVANDRQSYMINFIADEGDTAVNKIVVKNLAGIDTVIVIKTDAPPEFDVGYTNFAGEPNSVIRNINGEWVVFLRAGETVTAFQWLFVKTKPPTPPGQYTIMTWIEQKFQE